nr:FAD-dependent oxidoreductase [Nostoc sp. 'Peltigera malacea cyanobiont' DB3992]
MIFPPSWSEFGESVTALNQGIHKRLDDAGVKIVCAEASFVGERTVRGGDVTVEAPMVIVNTGTSSLIPDISGLAGTPYLTNRNFFDLKALPPRLLVIGAGYIGLELGQGLARWAVRPT